VIDPRAIVPGVVVERVFCGDVSLEVARVGEGAPIVLLHGFPEAWISWRHQMRAFAEANRMAVAPNLRGYGGSDKPRGVRNYRASVLAQDIVGLARAFGWDRIDLVGHDWGGAIAFEVAMRHPEIVRKLAVCNAPHPRIMRRRMFFDPDQTRRSWYFFAFQLPLIPERVVRRPDFVERVMKGSAVHPERFDDLSLQAIREVVQSPGTPEAALAYYRASMRFPRMPRAMVRATTLVIWGERDFALGPQLLDGIEKYVYHALIHRIPDAGHFVQQDAPEAVSEALVSFFSA
jgi:pimeloyl-ACP methyl ester carboxylesterase